MSPSILTPIKLTSLVNFRVMLVFLVKLVPPATVVLRDHLVSLEREVTPVYPENKDSRVHQEQLDNLDPLENRYNVS